MRNANGGEESLYQLYSKKNNKNFLVNGEKLHIDGLAIQLEKVGSDYGGEDRSNSPSKIVRGCCSNERIGTNSRLHNREFQACF